MSVIKIQHNSLSQEMGALGSLHTAPDTSWEELRGPRGGVLSFSLFSVSRPSLHNSPSEASVHLWSVYPRLCQSELVSWRLRSSALQYLCLLPCLRFLMTQPLWLKLEPMQMGCDVLWTAPALCVPITSHVLSSLNIASASLVDSSLSNTPWCRQTHNELNVSHLALNLTIEHSLNPILLTDTLNSTLSLRIIPLLPSCCINT